MRKLPRGENYLSRSFNSALTTLVDLSDTEIIPDLEAILQDPKLVSQRQSIFQSYLVKLKYQESPLDLLKIIEGERDSISTLRYAVLRYLWLTKGTKGVREALEKNQRKSVIVGYDIAQWCIEYFFEYKGTVISAEKLIPERQYDIPLHILNHDEFREYRKRRKTTKDKNDPEFKQWLRRYSVEGIVQAATKSQTESKKSQPQPVAPIE